MKRAVTASLLTTTAVVLGAAGAASAAVGTVGSLPRGVAAQVGDQRITFADLDRAVAQQLAQRPHPDRPAPVGSPAYTAARRAAMARLLSERIYVIEGARCGVPCAVTDAQVQARLGQLRSQEHLTTDAALTTYLARLRFTLPDVLALFRWQLQMQRIALRVTAPIRFTDADALAYYRAHLKTFHNPELRQARHIVLASQAEAARVRAGLTDANFADTARRVSIDKSSKDQGGDMGTVLAGGDPAFERALASLALRQISQPVHTKSGWEIIEVTQITPARTVPFAEVRTSLVQSQLALRQQAALNRWQRANVDPLRRRTVYADAALVPAR